MAGRFATRQAPTPDLQPPRLKDSDTQRAFDVLVSAIRDLQARVATGTPGPAGADGAAGPPGAAGADGAPGIGIPGASGITYLFDVSIATAALTGGAGVTNNNYNFGALGYVTYIPLSNAFLEQLAGVTNGGTTMGAGDDGKVICLYNDSANTLAIINEGAGTTAANRFTCLGAANSSLTTKAAIWFRYRGTNLRWECIGLLN